MSDINDQGQQDLAQAEAEAEAEALRALEAGAWRVWQAGSGPLPAAYARWCGAEVERATAGLRNRAEAAEAEVARLRGMMDRAVPYITQTGLGAAIYEAVKREARATPAERAAAGLAPEAPAQPQVIPGSLRGFPWDADWDKVIDGDAVIYGGRKITFRVEPFSADPHPAPAQPQQPQVLKEHLAYIEALADAQPYSWNTAESGPSKVCLAGRALRAALARRDGGAK